MGHEPQGLAYDLLFLWVEVLEDIVLGPDDGEGEGQGVQKVFVLEDVSVCVYTVQVCVCVCACVCVCVYTCIYSLIQMCRLLFTFQTI